MELAFGIILLVAAVFLVVAVLMQHGKSHGMSGTIAGSAETFGNSKGKTMDGVLSKITTVVAIAFCVLVIVMFMLQGKVTGGTSSGGTSGGGTDTTQSEESTEPSEDAQPTEGSSNTEAE